MTSPDLNTPANARGPSTLYNLRNVTQQSDADRVTADLQQLLDAFGLTWLSDFLGGFFNVIDAINSGIDQLVSLFGLDGLPDLFEVIEFIQGLVDAFLQALGGQFQPLIDFIGGLTSPPEWLHTTGWSAGVFQTLSSVQSLVAGVFYALATAINNVIPGPPGDIAEDYINRIADGINTTDAIATTAQSSADTAYTNAGAAYTLASSHDAAITEAQSTASNAASVAAAAQETADIAYENAQYNKDEFAVSSAGVFLGTNEEALGLIMTTPTGRKRIITRLIYSMKSNTGTMTVQLMKRTLAGAESIVHTTSIASAAITHPDNTIDYESADLDHYFCNVTAIGGTASVLHCCIESVIVEV